MGMGYFGEQVGVVDFAARRVLWLPQANGWPNAAWLTHTRLAYVIPSLLESSYLSNTGRLMVFDTSQLNLAPVEIANVSYFIAEPDGGPLAVVGQPPDADGEHIGLLSAEEDEIRWLTQGSSPMWAANGQQLVYSAFNQQTQLNLLDTQTGLTRTLVSAEDIQPLLPEADSVLQGLSILRVDKDYVYVAGYVGTVSVNIAMPDTWLGRIKLEGSGLQTLYYAKQSWANFYSSFEDQRYLLITAQSYNDNLSSFLVVEAATGRVARAIEGYTQWYSPGPTEAAKLLLMDAQGQLFSLSAPFDELMPYTPAEAAFGCGAGVRNPALSTP
jgi:hypothetical protein